MFFTSSITLFSSLLFLALPKFSSSTAIDNKAVAANIKSLSVVIEEGNFYIQNYENGKWLHYEHVSKDDAYDLFPTSGSSEATKVLLKPDGSTKKIRISVESHCGSAQWNDNEGLDWAMVMYDCIVLPSVDSTLNPDKQYWYFLPKSHVDKRKRALSSRSHSKRMRHRVEDFEERGEEVELEVRDKVTGETKLEKRSKVGPFYIIPYDHVLDMKTRALTGTAIATPGNAKSTYLAGWNPDSTNQLWYLYKA